MNISDKRVLKQLEKFNKHNPLTDDEMSLRDYFAAQAMPIITKELIKVWKNDDCFDSLDETEQDVIAMSCYEFADAMMKARKE
jgi:hypothetical protein